MSKTIRRQDIFMSTSDLASFIAHHQYKSQSRALQTVWKKNFPMKYAHLLTMCNVKMDRIGYCRRLIQGIFNNTADTQMRDTLRQYYIYHDNPGYATLLQQQILAMLDQRLPNKHHEKTYDMIRSTALDWLKCQIGIQEEDNGIRRYEEKIQRTLTCKNEETASMVVHLNNKVRVKIYGRIDAYDPESRTIIEHKQRQSCFLTQIPAHERIQLYVYMRVQKCHRAISVQSYRGETRVLDTIEWNTQEWEYYMHQLQYYMDQFIHLTTHTSTKEQCEYFKRHFLLL